MVTSGLIFSRITTTLPGEAIYSASLWIIPLSPSYGPEPSCARTLLLWGQVMQ